MKVSEVYDKDQQLEQALDAVANIEPDFEKCLNTVADKDTDYEIEFAKAYLAAEGSIEARKATATVKCRDYLKERNKAKAVKEFLKEKLRDRQAAVSARQSLLAASLRTNDRF